MLNNSSSIIWLKCKRISIITNWISNLTIIFFYTDTTKSNSNNISIKDNNNKKHIQSWIFFLLNAKWDDLCLARRHQRLCCALWSEQWKSQAMSTLWGEPGFFRGWSSLTYICLAKSITTYHNIREYLTHIQQYCTDKRKRATASISVPISLFKLLLRISLFLMVLNIIRTWVSKGVESGKRVYQLLLPLAGRTPPFLTSWVVDSGRPCARVGFQVGSLCRPVNGSLRHNVHCTTTQQTYLDT